MVIWLCHVTNHYRFFKESSEEEREHAEKFMEYQVLNFPSSLCGSLCSMFKFLLHKVFIFIDFFLNFHAYRTNVVGRWSCNPFWCRCLSLIMPKKETHFMVSHVLLLFFGELVNLIVTSKIFTTKLQINMYYDIIIATIKTSIGIQN